MNPEFLAYIKGCNLWTLRAMLKILQTRLGTNQERPNDVERAQVIAHQINAMTVGPAIAPAPLPEGEIQPRRFVAGQGVGSVSRIGALADRNF